jgi:hypothetical protein
MIGFIGTSLQLQPIMTAHTLNFFWTTSVWLISDWSEYLEFTNQLHFISATRPYYKSPRLTINCPVILFVVTGMSLLIFVAEETGASEPLPRKLTSASASIPVFRQCLPSRCLAMDYSVTISSILYAKNNLTPCSPMSLWQLFCIWRKWISGWLKYGK